MAVSLTARPVAPVFIESFLDDPEFVRRFAERHGPYLPVQRYVANAAQSALIGDPSSSHQDDDAPPIIAPVFRGDWFDHDAHVAGVEPLLHHPALLAAARSMFEADIVRPVNVYANLTYQLPFAHGNGHVDVPAFYGIDRSTTPIWLLLIMGHSGLFRAEQIDIATAVAWYYEGPDGGFDYWPAGADAEPVTHEGCIHNTCIVGDNDFMFHRVRATGALDDGMLSGLTLATELAYVGDGLWAIAESGTVHARFGWDRLRMSLSWKAHVFADAAAEQEAHDPRRTLTLDDVVDRFRRDLRDRGVEYVDSDAPLGDGTFLRLLAETYHCEPSVRPR